MDPRHFWWLVETMAPPAKRGMAREDADACLALLNRALEDHHAKAEGGQE